MKFSIRIIGMSAIIKIFSPVVQGEEGQLEDAIEKAAVTNNRIVIDLSECDNITSQAVGILLIAHKKMIAIGGKFYLASPSPRIEDLLNVINIRSVFEILTNKSDMENFD